MVCTYSLLVAVACPESPPACRHRSEILQRPQYARLKIGQIEGQEQRIRTEKPGDISLVSPTFFVSILGLTNEWLIPF